jgi:hypothetical protein
LLFIRFLFCFCRTCFWTSLLSECKTFCFKYEAKYNYRRQFLL